jgi:hypothetical protein
LDGSSGGSVNIGPLLPPASVAGGGCAGAKATGGTAGLGLFWTSAGSFDQSIFGAG